MNRGGTERRAAGKAAPPRRTLLGPLPNRWVPAPRGSLAALGGLAVALLVALPGGVARGPASHPATGLVLAVTQTRNVSENDTFTVAVQVANPTLVNFSYFTFCEVTSAKCFPPIAMTSQSGGWFTGSTRPMSSYLGMGAGVSAGYNITIDYKNNTNVTEPRLPNAFANLTVATVAGSYYYRMTVRPLTFGLTGLVTDQATGAGVAGARVNLTPGVNWTITDSRGNYVFGDLFNGTYELSAARSGYRSSEVAVTINGGATSQNVAITNLTAPPTPVQHPSSAGPFAILEGPVGYAAIGIAVVAIALAAVLVRRRRKAATSPARNAAAAAESPPPTSEPPGAGGR